MTEVWKGIRWTIGIAIGLAIVFGAIIAGRAAFEVIRSEGDPREREQAEKQTQEWLEECIAREFRISKNDFRFRYMLEEYTVCHAERDGVSTGPLSPSDEPTGPVRPIGQKSPTQIPMQSQTPTPVPTPAPTPQAYIECMNLHDDYLTCRCLLDDSAPGCR